ncbi:Hypothetical protein PHPALM_280, partial [Phytophthora palmivora]
MEAATPSEVASRPSKTPAGPEDAPEIVGEPVTLEELVAPTAASKTKDDAVVVTEENNNVKEEENNEKEEDIKPIEETTDDANESGDWNDPSETDVAMVDLAFDDDEDEFHEAMEDGVDLLDDDAVKPAVPPTMSFSVNEMEVITNRGGRTGSLSKFLDDADTFRR